MRQRLTQAELNTARFAGLLYLVIIVFGTVLVSDRVEFVARFDQPADHETPLMFHCHIFEHEDDGMVGQITVG